MSHVSDRISIGDICSADHTATLTIGHNSIDISVIRDTQRPSSFVQDLRRDETRG